MEWCQNTYIAHQTKKKVVPALYYDWQWKVDIFWESDISQPSALSARPNCFRWKTMLCVWWDQLDIVCNELLNIGETVNDHGSHHQLIKLHCALHEERTDYQRRHDKLIFLLNNAPITHVNNGPKVLGGTQLGGPTPCCLFTRAGRFWLPPLFVDGPCAHTEQHFDSYKDVRKWLDEWFASKKKEYFLVWNPQIAKEMGKMGS